MIGVVTAEQARAADAAAIASGTPSFQLMRTAGEHAAALIGDRYPDRLSRVLVLAGPGNNGGDGYIVAGALAAAGHSPRIQAVAPPRSSDAQQAAAWASSVSLGAYSDGAPTLIVDALLGTGSTGRPRGRVADAIREIATYRADGIPIVSLDVPSGMDATTGVADGAVRADWTITFGHMKRGLLVARGASGAITVVDIGLGTHGREIPGSPGLIDEAWVSARVPGIPAEAHKGVRCRVAMVGGDRGMAGATVLAARAAMRSGIGMVRLVVSEQSLAAVQVGAPEATAATWPADDDRMVDVVSSYAQAVLIGPGLGRDSASQRTLEQLLRVWTGPVVLDADALTLFAGRLDELRARLSGRAAVLTPHAGECARLLGCSVEEVLANRFTAPFELSDRTGAVVLLKGVPTVIASPDGRGVVSATGTPVLAAAGSGDVLSGIVVTLLAQTGHALDSAACAAWVHGRAAELANLGRPVRGVVLDDVCRAISAVWRFQSPPLDAPVMAELPAVGDDARLVWP
ncbi:MAG: NAD(P)H-hydrate dehydratase [Gemmatimonadaceae bacterium]